jgi:sugar/nucleoside kinase (ribokinase family)
MPEADPITTVRSVPSRSSPPSGAPDAVEKPGSGQWVANLPVALGAGLIALDILMRACPTTNGTLRAGGSCANVLAILSALGWRCYPVARFSSDPAGREVRSDLVHWGVQIDLSSVTAESATPIIVDRLAEDRRGVRSHRFSWRCPACGIAFPRYRSIPAATVRVLGPIVTALSPQVVFLDRVSPAAVLLGEATAAAGGIVVFEPSAISNPSQFARVRSLAHIVKYSRERLRELPPVRERSLTFLEVQTLGDHGLRYRMDQAQTGVLGDWRELPAFTVEQFADASGAGDWCTAGILNELCRRGLTNLLGADESAVAAALNKGQAMAAWNCGFDGARGAMYADFSIEVLHSSVQQILDTQRARRSAGRHHTQDATNNVVRVNNPLAQMCVLHDHSLRNPRAQDRSVESV